MWPHSVVVGYNLWTVVKAEGYIAMSISVHSLTPHQQLLSEVVATKFVCTHAVHCITLHLLTLEYFHKLH